MKTTFTLGVSLLLASIACTAYKSAGSQPRAESSTTAPPSPTLASQTQERVPCTLKLPGAPTISGLRLGMTVNEILALFPGSQDDPETKLRLSRAPNQFGESELQLIPAKYQKNEQPLPISQISLTMVDGRVARLRIGLNGPQYSHVDQLVNRIIAETGLPPINAWEAYVGMDNSLKTLKCSEFDVSVFAGGKGGNLNYVEIHDLVAEKKVEDRRAKERAEATPTT